LRQPVRVLVVDDDDRAAHIARVVLEDGSGRFAVVGRARHGGEALQLAEALAPDVLVLDLHMPILGGIETLRRLRAQGSDVAVVVASASDQPDEVAAALDAGASGYVSKGELLARLAPEILRALGRSAAR
jgi:DNA-binding NarL/FixJ family response regulator